jgi:hypothetical protein
MSSLFSTVAGRHTLSRFAPMGPKQLAALKEQIAIRICGRNTGAAIDGTDLSMDFTLRLPDTKIAVRAWADVAGNPVATIHEAGNATSGEIDLTRKDSFAGLLRIIEHHLAEESVRDTARLTEARRIFANVVASVRA